MNYKDTLNPTFTNFRNKTNTNNLKYDDIQMECGESDYLLIDGPPYANGNLHIGHALNKILKDFVCRTNNVSFTPGWDCHGLPIEHSVEKQKGRNLTISKILEYCEEHANHWVKEQSNQFKKYNVRADWENHYKTLNWKKEIAAEFFKHVANGNVEVRSSPTMWSVFEQTALSDAETHHKEVENNAFKFGYDVVGYDNVKVLCYTTMPWTIPMGQVVCFNPNIEYALYGYENTYFIQSVNSASASDNKLREVSESELKSMVLSHPFKKQNSFWDYEVPLISNEIVDDFTGTGFLHVAGSHGQDDYKICKSLGIEPVEYLDNFGMFRKDIPYFGNQYIMERNGNFSKTLQDTLEKLLTENNSLYQILSITHDYPFSDREKKPVIYKSTQQVFINLDSKLKDKNYSLRQRAIELSENEVDWSNDNSKNKMIKMLEDRPDWCVSRQRAWGVPIMLFINDNNEFIKNSEMNNYIMDQLKDSDFKNTWYDSKWLNHLISKFDISSEFKPCRYVLDVWFDSGTIPSLLSPKKKASIVIEGKDQFRGWFQSTLLHSAAIYDTTPYKKVLSHGFVLNENGTKMSKSDISMSPDKIIKKYGIDVLRMWVALSDYNTDIKIGNQQLNQAQSKYYKIRNTIRFCLMNTHSFTYDNSIKLNEIDMMYLSVFKSEIDKSKTYLKDLEFSKSINTLYDVCNQLLSSEYFDIMKDTLYCDNVDDQNVKSCKTALLIIIDYLSEILNVYIPSTVKELTVQKTVHSIENMTSDYNHLKQIRSNFPNDLSSKIINLMGKDANVPLSLRELKTFFRSVDVISDPELDEDYLEIDSNYSKCRRCWNMQNENPHHCNRCQKIIERHEKC